MNQKEAIMYANGPAYNHGCEAIVRSTIDLLSLEKEKTLLFSNNIQGDFDYKLDDIVKIESINETPVKPNSPLGVVYRACSYLYNDHEKMYYRFFGKKSMNICTTKEKLLSPLVEITIVMIAEQEES